jgi:hypothetical protein
MAVNTNYKLGRRFIRLRFWNPHDFVEGSAAGAVEVTGGPPGIFEPIDDLWRRPQASCPRCSGLLLELPRSMPTTAQQPFHC